MDLSTIALQGLQQADAQLETATVNFASIGSAPPDGANLDTVDLSAELVALTSAQVQTSANISLLKTANEIQKTAIDLTA